MHNKPIDIEHNINEKLVHIEKVSNYPYQIYKFTH